MGRRQFPKLMEFSSVLVVYLFIIMQVFLEAEDLALQLSARFQLRKLEAKNLKASCSKDVENSINHS
jgi:hypothetical protein